MDAPRQHAPQLLVPGGIHIYVLVSDGPQDLHLQQVHVDLRAHQQLIDIQHSHAGVIRQEIRGFRMKDIVIQRVRHLRYDDALCLTLLEGEPVKGGDAFLLALVPITQDQVVKHAKILEDLAASVVVRLRAVSSASDIPHQQWGQRTCWLVKAVSMDSMDLEDVSPELDVLNDFIETHFDVDWDQWSSPESGTKVWEGRTIQAKQTMGVTWRGHQVSGKHATWECHQVERNHRQTPSCQ